MDKTYSPQMIEESSYAQWEKANYFKPTGEGPAYTIILPPPNVTGSLHMGHGFQNTLMDALIRYHRMSGAKVLWQPGTDHAGISTQLMVEAWLDKEGLARKDMTREEFLERVWAWKEEYGGLITRQMRRLGVSVDWSRERFTMDDASSAAVQKVFIELFEEGLIYRGTRLVNWDPKLGTAVSDLEVKSEQESGFLWTIRYSVVDSEEFLLVATTRPETLLGDVAVAVHPDDERYAHLVGKDLQLPLCDRRIPIVADSYVDKEFGSGCVKITPAHDFNDYELGKRHNLPLINIFTKKATINKNAPLAYQAMDRFVARDRILEDLKIQGCLIKTEPHLLNIPRGEKSNTVIEPLLTDQWYVKTKVLAKPAMEAVENGSIRFIPELWSKTYFQWMEDIQDWCISRQLWWGHRIPAWYDSLGHVYVGQNEEDVRYKYHLDSSVSLRQDEDVLDTWFSSALWPFSSLGWPKTSEDFETFYPTSILVTGFDIIFFWVARMVMMALKFTGQVPFKEVMITGLICDQDGAKMSKTKGNVLDPIDVVDGISLDDLIQKRTNHLMMQSMRDGIVKATQTEFPQGIAAYGADALRFTYCAMASPTRMIRFDLNRVEGYRNFCNKLWNASRFVLLNTAEEKIDFGDGAFQYSSADEWILSTLQSTIASCHEHFKNYRLDYLASELYDFVWHQYCDWYLEFSKSILYDEEALASKKRGTRRTLVYVLEQILKLLHPLMPFITEAIWTKTTNLSEDHSETIMLSQYPKVDASLINPELETEIDWLKKIIQAIRTIRSDLSIAPSKRIPMICQNSSKAQEALLSKYLSTLINLAKLTTVELHKDPEALAASAVVDGMELFIPLTGLIDKDFELNRLEKEISKLRKDMLLAESKLTNPKFIENAPAAVIAKEQEKLESGREAVEKLLAHHAQLETLH